MSPVATLSVPYDLGVDIGAALLRALVFLEDEAPCPLAHHQAVALAVEGPRRTLGRVRVAGGRSAHDVEYPRVQDVQFLGATPETNGHAAEAHLLVGDPDAL